MLIVLSMHSFAPASQLRWPQVTRQCRPWTRWWWQGSSVNKKDLTAVMENYKKAGLGGLEITPIYGVRGYEDQFVPYLSPEWVDLFVHTLQESERLDLGIDMATGTGWPFGGPWIGAEAACKNFVHKTYQLNGGQKLREKVIFNQPPMARAIGKRIGISDVKEPISENENLQELALEQIRFEKPLPLQVLMACSENGEFLDITDRVDESGNLDWTAPAGSWTIDAVFQGWHGKMVERAAPGGEGNVIDHFSKDALSIYLEKFNQAFSKSGIGTLRAFFNDSYEVDDASGEANYTPDLFTEFKNRKGYDLARHLSVLFSTESTGERSRLLHDYREVISELLLDNFTKPWRDWAKSQGAIVRNQAHGSPANILDLYAVSDIPETEGRDVIQYKFASSAANVTGKILASCEAATWLDEHFTASLGDVKHALDLFFLGGINHVVFHGTPYSPADESWPGWLFYAAVHFGPTNSLWADFPKLNRYITRCQSFLQLGKPSNDILLYYPIHDRWSEPGNSLLHHFKGSLDGLKVRGLAEDLLKQGFSFDFISDRQLLECHYNGSDLQTSGNSYRTVVIPECQFMPLESMEKLAALAQAGGHVIFCKKMPSDVPGLSDLRKKQTAYVQLARQWNFEPLEGQNISCAAIGKGGFVLGDDIRDMLHYAGVLPESIPEHDLRYVKRKTDDGFLYFIVNQSGNACSDWIRIRAKAASVAQFDPMSGEAGLAASRSLQDGSTGIFLQLNPGEACILQCFNDVIKAPRFTHYRVKAKAVEIGGPWKLRFITGGPVLPDEIHTDKLMSWTGLGGRDVRRFSGTGSYTVHFSRPGIKADAWILDLGAVRETAVVVLNGVTLDTLISAPYQIRVPDTILRDRNELDIQVTNLMANRIIDMDQNGGDYKKFYNVNFPAKDRENRDAHGLFTAASWEPVESGLLGPVKIIPLVVENMAE
ncbi:glycoside hydrolase family 2 protein [bacterium]|nr:glycoside hydrolase family 2 protein [bacterium]